VENSELLLIFYERDGRAGFETYNLKTKEANQPTDLISVGLANPLPNDPENVLLVRWRDMDLDLLKFNIRTGRAKQVPVPSGYIRRWFTNADGKVIAGLGWLHERWFMIVPQGGDWRRVELGDKRRPDFQPAMVAEDQRRVVGFDFTRGDTVAVVTWDPATDTKELLCAADTWDAEYLMAQDDDWTRMQYLSFEADRPRFRYLNPDDQAVADAIDGALPGTTNYIVSATPDKSKLIIVGTSDRVAGDFYLFDVKTKKLVKFGANNLQLQPGRLVPSRYFDFPSRDGLQLHGRIYLPPGQKGPLPTVVTSFFPRRTYFSYDSRAQALVSHGYGVVEIETRGVEGYGEKFWAAGNQQMDGKMIDDLLDGIDWLAQKSLVDPKRVALLSYGYGSLVTVQAAARHPERFAALVNFWAPAYFDYFDYMDFVFGRLTRDDIKTRLGGETGVRRYMNKLNPVEPIAAMRIPSFHYYPRTAGHGLWYEGERVRNALKKNATPHVFLEGIPVRSPNQLLGEWSPDFPPEWRRIYAELLPFLDQYVTRK